MKNFRHLWNLKMFNGIRTTVHWNISPVVAVGLPWAHCSIHLSAHPDRFLSVSCRLHTPGVFCWGWMFVQMLKSPESCVQRGYLSHRVFLVSSCGLTSVLCFCSCVFLEQGGWILFWREVFQAWCLQCLLVRRFSVPQEGSSLDAGFLSVGASDLSPLLLAAPLGGRAQPTRD